MQTGEKRQKEQASVFRDTIPSPTKGLRAPGPTTDLLRAQKLFKTIATIYSHGDCKPRNDLKCLIIMSRTERRVTEISTMFMTIRNVVTSERVHILSRIDKD